MSDFTTGQKVKLIKDLSDSYNPERFKIVSWNDSEYKGRVEDSDGRCWNVSGNQIEIVEDVEGFEFADEEKDEPEDYESMEEDDSIYLISG